MTDFEFYEVLEAIANDGRGYDAIVKLAIMLEHKNTFLKEKFLKESKKNGGHDE